MRTLPVRMLLVLALLVVAVAPLTLRAPQANAQEVTLKMGLLPILDVLPFYVADQQGYFTDAGLKVELVPVSSALERDQLLLAGEIDGMLNDLVSTGIFNADKTRIQIVAMARRAYVDSPQFRILAAPGSGITTPEDVKGVEIGISENSVIHYIAQRIMESAGLSDSDLKWRAEPNIAVRYQLLMEGQMKVACLPDPLAQAAIVGGATLIADDSALVDSEFSQSVLSFRTEVIDKQPEAVKAFLMAWMRAADDVNDNPDAFRDLWLEKTNVPDSVKDTYVLPPFPTYTITQEPAWTDTVNWLVEQGIVDKAAAYADSVNDTFLSQIIPLAPAMSTTGDAANGQALFASLGCSACHAVDSDATLVGPSLLGLGEEAGDVPGLTIEQYIAQSIVDPGAYVVEEFQNIMPSFEGKVSEGELADLVAYIMSLK
jgi:NitT/TauT family transport system substrate-binding protein